MGNKKLTKTDAVYQRPKPYIAVLTGIGAAAASLFPVLYFAVPGLFGYLLIVGGLAQCLVALSLGLLGTYLLTGTVAGLMLLLPTIAVGVCLSVSIVRRQSYFDIALLCAAIMAGLAFLSISYEDMQRNLPPFSTFQAAFTDLGAEVLEQLLLANQTTAALPQARIDEFALTYTRLAVMLPTYMPAALCMIGAAMGLSNLLFCMRFCRKTIADATIKPMRRFIFWRLPRSFIRGAMFLIAGTFVLFLLDAPGIQAASNVVSTIIMIPFAVQGVSVLFFMFYTGMTRPHMRALLIIALVLSFPVSVFFLMLYGALEQLFHLRRRLMRPKQGDDS